MRRNTAVMLTAAMLPAMLALGSCSASSSSSSASATNAGLSTSQLDTALKTATSTASALHIKGNYTETSVFPYSFDIQLNKDGTASGSFSTVFYDSSSQSGMTMTQADFITVNGVSYLHCTASLLALEKPNLTPGMTTLLLNKWVPLNGPMGTTLQPTSYTGYLSLAAFLKNNDLAGSPDSVVGKSAYAADGTADVNGQSAAQYKFSGQNFPMPFGVAELSIPASGPALPLQLTGATVSATAGTLTFTWNHPTTVTAPPADQIYTGPITLAPAPTTPATSN